MKKYFINVANKNYENRFVWLLIYFLKISG